MNYPTKNNDANLNMIKSLKKEFPSCIVGYSDHTLPSNDMQNLITSFFLGAKVIEKHFTLSKKKLGNDHYHSLDSKDLKIFNKRISYISSTLGVDKKNFIKSELTSRKNARRSIVLIADKKKGYQLKKKDLISKRPATGISPIFTKKLIGKKLRRDLKSDTILSWKHIL